MLLELTKVAAAGSNSSSMYFRSAAPALPATSPSTRHLMRIGEVAPSASRRRLLSLAGAAA